MIYGGPRTFGAVVAARAAERPGDTFVRFESSALTYEQWHSGGNRVAHALAGLGLRKGDTAAVMLPNGPEFLVTWLGLARLGVLEVPINVAYKGDLLAYLLAEGDPRHPMFAPDSGD